MLFKVHKMPLPFVRQFLKKGSLTARAFTNPRILGKTGYYNIPALQAIEVPAANGIGNARAIAKAYSEFATGGKKLGIRPETLAALEAKATPSGSGLFDEVLRVSSAFSLGYLKPFKGLEFGSSERAYGTPGAGGSFGFADPDKQLGFSYVMNRCGFYIWNDPREAALRNATYRCLNKN